MKVADSIALVTGANRGIGRALVAELLQAGARKVYATGRSLDALQAVRDLAPQRVTPLLIDVANRSTIAAAAATAGDTTLLINNAGVIEFGNVLEVAEERIAHQFATNFYGKLSMARAFAPVIERNGGGAIVNVLTLVALASMPGLSTYNATKAAAWSMTQSLRAALAGKGIEVFGVFPGAVDTDMLAGVQMAKAPPADIAKAVIRGIDTGVEDIFPDPMSTQLYAAWRQDHKAVERQFATM
jgi:NAD(P)-dependent dehydrogenase (short-subunit alcohol dehydrogenase family)